jgi:hypothetical protein
MTISYHSGGRLQGLSTDALVAHLKFNGNVTDSAGSNNGTVTGTTTYVTGKVDNAFSFNGSSYVTLANESNFDFTNSVSISAWIYPTTGSTTQAIIGKVLTSGTYSTIFLMRMNTSNELSFTYSSGTGGVFHTYDSANTISLNTWTHVVISYTYGTASSMDMYINGVRESGSWTNGTGNVAVDSNDAVAVVGANRAAVQQFNGKLDDVRIYSREIDQNEVNMIYNSGNGTEKNKPTNVPDGSRFEETDTRKFYTKDVNGWQEKGNELGYRHASTYAQNQPAEANPFTTINKQHFVEWFSGKGLPDGWTVRGTYNSGGTFAMNNSVDGGGRLATATNADSKVALDFNNNGMVYSSTGSVMITVVKAVDINTNQGLKVIFSNTNTNEGGSSQFGILYMTSSGLYVRHNATNTSVTGLSMDTDWHSWKFELLSASGKVTKDGVLLSTVTTTLPTSTLQPSFIATTGGAGGSRRLDIRYCEAYNT